MINALNLETTTSDVSAVLALSEAKTLKCVGKHPDCSMELALDFGTVFVGERTENELNPTPEELEALLCQETHPALLMTAPKTWKLQHLVSKLGMFPSASQAAKNGFQGDIPAGFSQHVVRLNKKRGVVTVFKFFD